MGMMGPLCIAAVHIRSYLMLMSISAQMEGKIPVTVLNNCIFIWACLMSVSITSNPSPNKLPKSLLHRQARPHSKFFHPPQTFWTIPVFSLTFIYYYLPLIPKALTHIRGLSVSDFFNDYCKIMSFIFFRVHVRSIFLYEAWKSHLCFGPSILSVRL